MKISKKLYLLFLLLGSTTHFQTAPAKLQNAMLKIADSAGFFNDALFDIKLVGKALINFLKGNSTWTGLLLHLKVITGDKKGQISLLFKDIALIYGTTYVVISHNHPKVKEFLTVEQKELYNGVDDIFTGSYVIHPLTKKKLPLYASNYVNANYAMRTQHAYLAIPAHKYDDFYFAKKHNLPIILIIEPTTDQVNRNFRKADLSYHGVLRSPYIVQYDECHILHNPSQPLKPLTGSQAKAMVEEILIKNKQAEKYTTKIRYSYNNRLETFSNMLKIEAFVIKNEKKFTAALIKEKKAELALILSYAHSDFLEIVESFLASVKNTRQLMLPLVEESTKVHETKDSYLMKWSKMESNECERVRFKRDILTFNALAYFCSNLIEFLGDLSNSCPHAQAYLDSLQHEQ